MTAPYSGEDMRFVNEGQSTGESIDLDAAKPLVPEGVRANQKRFPPAILNCSDEQKKSFIVWLDEWINDLIASQLPKQSDWVDQEEAYRAKPGAAGTMPYVGHDTTTVPAIAMAVDPIHARLDVGIFKQDRPFTLKALKKSVVPYVEPLSQWIDYYQRNRLQLRQVASPRLLELTKLGTCVFKTVYDRQAGKIKTYDYNTWEVIERDEVRFAGPRVFGVSLGDFLFPPSYQNLQDCPIVVERQRTSYGNLKVAEASGKLADVDKIKGQETHNRTQLEDAQDESANHRQVRVGRDDFEVWEAWCDYDINGDGIPEHLVATYHRETHTLLQLRYNWYFHQRKPFTVIPYTVTNGSLYGIGICEMVLPFQEALTKWNRMATDNAYLANIRMFIVKKESGIEAVPRLYAGRCFFVDDPKSDFIPFAAGEIYPSTLTERQNLFGLSEKRTGVSDYLTGRESPIIGSRATATSTLALIQEGTKRVEEVLENIRQGFAEIIQNCLYIWIQYGTDDLDEIVFGDDDIAVKLKEFFSKFGAENVNGAIAIDLAATDANNNRQAMQQMQLQIIQIMMQYLEKLLAAGQAALQAQQIQPDLTAMITDVMKASRNMFKDLLTKYDIRNPEDYLPDLERYLGGPNAAQPGVPAGTAGGPSGVVPFSGVPARPGTLPSPAVPMPSAPGSGGAGAQAVPAAGAGVGV